MRRGVCVLLRGVAHEARRGAEFGAMHVEMCEDLEGYMRGLVSSHPFEHQAECCEFQAGDEGECCGAEEGEHLCCPWSGGFEMG